ncbi:hypothetical protein FQA39_LY14485 [Lamprigera yunnana]|nr:hypothetical protein FQA39_LY14485 [Lamprigera yunnana]
MHIISKFNYKKHYTKGTVLPTVKMTCQVFRPLNKIEVNTPLLVLHGLLASKKTFRSVCSFLARDLKPSREVISIDARNHGGSPHVNETSYELMAEDVKVFLTDSNISKSCFIGYCMGGRTSMWFALNYPHLVDKLIIVESSPIEKSPYVNVVPNLLKALKEVKIDRNQSLDTLRNDVKQRLTKISNDTRMIEFLAMNLYTKSDNSIAWQLNIEDLETSFSKNLINFPKTDRTFTGPTLFIQAEFSKFLLNEHHNGILKLFPNAEFVVIKGAGHWLHVENVKEFIKLCVKFLSIQK